MTTSTNYFLLYCSLLILSCNRPLTAEALAFPGPPDNTRSGTASPPGGGWFSDEYHAFFGESESVTPTSENGGWWLPAASDDDAMGDADDEHVIVNANIVKWSRMRDNHGYRTGPLNQMVACSRTRKSHSWAICWRRQYQSIHWGLDGIVLCLTPNILKCFDLSRGTPSNLTVNYRLLLVQFESHKSRVCDMINSTE